MIHDVAECGGVGVESGFLEGVGTKGGKEDESVQGCNLQKGGVCKLSGVKSGSPAIDTLGEESVEEFEGIGAVL